MIKLKRRLEQSDPPKAHWTFYPDHKTTAVLFVPRERERERETPDIKTAG